MLKVPIFWSIVVSGASFTIIWAGFNYHAADIMNSLANMTPTETADAVFVPMSITIGLSSFTTGMF